MQLNVQKILTNKQEAERHSLKQRYWERNASSSCYNTNADHSVFSHLLLLSASPL